jgi:NhaP-type Na+/H+ or K+/H+ antiporter
MMAFSLVIWLTAGHSLSARSRYLGDGSAAALTGLAVGGCLLLARAASLLSPAVTAALLTFDASSFFVVYLPPIILHAGLSVRKKAFFEHVGVIAALGIGGTYFAFGFVAALLWLVAGRGAGGGAGGGGGGAAGVVGQGPPFEEAASAVPLFSLLPPRLRLSLGDCLALGAIFAATDSVAVLQVLEPSRAPMLFSLVFGEGVVNDATTVALLRTVAALRPADEPDVGPLALLSMGVSFCVLFAASLVLGESVGKCLFFPRGERRRKTKHVRVNERQRGGGRERETEGRERDRMIRFSKEKNTEFPLPFELSCPKKQKKTIPGVAAGLGGALLLKKARPPSAPAAVGVVAAAAYCSYALADSLSLSGIVALFCTAVALSHYGLPSLSRDQRGAVLGACEAASFLAEGAVFVFVGLDALDPRTWAKAAVGPAGLLALAILAATLLARACFLFPVLRVAHWLAVRGDAEGRARERRRRRIAEGLLRRGHRAPAPPAPSAADESGGFLEEAAAGDFARCAEEQGRQIQREQRRGEPPEPPPPPPAAAPPPPAAPPAAKLLGVGEMVVAWWAGAARGAVSVALVFFYYSPRMAEATARGALEQRGGGRGGGGGGGGGEGGGGGSAPFDDEARVATLVAATLAVVLFSTVGCGSATKPILDRMLGPGPSSSPSSSHGGGEEGGAGAGEGGLGENSGDGDGDGRGSSGGGLSPFSHGHSYTRADVAAASAFASEAMAQQQQQQARVSGSGGGSVRGSHQQQQVELSRLRIKSGGGGRGEGEADVAAWSGRKKGVPSLPVGALEEEGSEGGELLPRRRTSSNGGNGGSARTFSPPSLPPPQQQQQPQTLATAAFHSSLPAPSPAAIPSFSGHAAAEGPRAAAQAHAQARAQGPPSLGEWWATFDQRVMRPVFTSGGSEGGGAAAGRPPRPPAAAAVERDTRARGQRAAPAPPPPPPAPLVTARTEAPVVLQLFAAASPSPRPSQQQQQHPSS